MGKFGNCCCGCLIFEDGFNRPDKADLDPPWCEVAGAYEINDNECLYGTGGLAVLDVKHPDDVGAMVVSYQTIDEAVDSGDKYRILLNVQKTGSSATSCSTSNYYFAEYERQGTTLSKIRLGIVSGGVESILATEDVISETGLTRRFTAQISEDEFCAGVGQALESFVGIKLTTGLFANGYYCGFSLSDEDMRIDDFRFEKHKSTDQDCSGCICSCEGTPLPPELNVCIYPDPSDCLRLDLLSPCCFTIYWDRTNNEWSGSETCCGENQGWEIKFYCPNPYDDPETAVMTIAVGCTSSCGGCSGPNYPSSYDCGQPCFTYGPYNVSGTDLTCFCSSSYDIFTRGSCDFYVKVCAVDCC